MYDFLNSIGEDFGKEPDAPDASAGVVETDAPQIEEAPVVEQDIREEAPVTDESNTGEVQETEVPDTTEADILAQMKEAAQEQPTDSSVIKQLRSLLRNRVEQVETQIAPDPAVAGSQQEAVELYNELFAFDTEAGAPTTKGFANKLVEKDSNIASQVLADLAFTPVKDAKVNGWTFGHQFLEQIGLDPMKLDELRQFSRGEIQLPQNLANEEVPDFVPKEYAEAYSKLNPLVKRDVDIYLTNEDPNQKSAAMQLLQDKHRILEQETFQQRNAQEQQQQMLSEITTEVDTQLGQTFDNLLDSVKKNKIYSEVKLSSNQVLDTNLKDAVISQINALGDDNSVLAKRAVSQLTSLGVQVDTAKVGQLLNDIRENTRIAVQATRLAKATGKDYSAQIQGANQRKAEATSRALALANKYFSDAVKGLSPKGQQVIDGEVDTGIPNLSGHQSNNGVENGVKRALSPAELDQLFANASKGLRGAAAE